MPATPRLPSVSAPVLLAMRHQQHYDNTKAERDLGFATTVPLVETFQRQIRWMEDAGTLRRVGEEPCEDCLLDAWRAGTNRIDDPRWVDFNPWGNNTEN